MANFRGVFAGVLVCVAVLATAQTHDQWAAQRVLGPHWKQISRSAGTIFAGTVLDVEKGQRPGWGTPVLQVQFQVDRAIAGARAGQVFTLREWAGAWGTHRPMRRGDRLLIFLYPPSRLGLSSPVGGALGQVRLDPSGKTVTILAKDMQTSRMKATRLRTAVNPTKVSVLQLERAIRSARGARE